MKIDIENPLVRLKEADEVYKDIVSNLDKDGVVTIDLKNTHYLAFCCARKIFGQLYEDLGPQDFHKRIVIKNATSDLKIIIQESLLDIVNFN